MYIFLCDSETEGECKRRRLVGTVDNDWTRQNLGNLEPGDFVLLYNYDTYTYSGPYIALSKLVHALEPEAWRTRKRGGFPLQVRLGAQFAIAAPIPHARVEDLIPLSGTKVYRPPAYVEPDKESKILQRLGVPSRQIDRHPAEVSNGFIFICGKTTAGTCFKNNLMGAPAQMIDVVRRVQRGDYVFLWHREERRLFGPWRAIARGEWNELLGESFDPERRERFPAVVRCERVGGYTRNYEYHAGLAQEVVERALGRTIEKYPPAQLSYDQTSRLLVALADSMEVRTHTPPDPEHSRRAEDGHWVRSDAEARIDDWLYRNNVRHEYEPAVPVSGAAMYGDWYLPESRVYVEYLGRMDSQKYADRTAEKRRRYAAVGLRVVELTPKHLEFLDELLRKELRAAGVQLKD